ncbi:hypothetical protein M431DRAFT_489354 [Trichoderma harzianum CBS 226.95]|uniref:Uncharacterized protein n=1 Tax=Trichoderma harzianum CBS 226.95 TaxID=983964 RepID=A0A2T4AUE4_TRIHA|nr:hypothetical protein M431DRAFT_489354 [Trichoderma harzianum CBS 226.95]PTB60588.1 hypothetical protein M431DRAFT_489354 [Trichoderma harzianum CBS 226.95]
MGILVQYASQKRHRQAFSERLFDKALLLSEKKILGRIRPPWAKQPSYMSKKITFPPRPAPSACPYCETRTPSDAAVNDAIRPGWRAYRVSGGIETANPWIPTGTGH